MNYTHFDTLQVHAGHTPDPSHGSCVTPIHQTASFVFNSVEHGAKLFALEEAGHIYTRLSNPTTDVFEKRIAALEGGTAAVAVSSGHASQFLIIQNLAESGDNIISSSSLYGGTYNQFKISFKKLGIDFRFAKKGSVEEYEKLIDNKTKAIYIESIGNSDFYIPDFESIAQLCKKNSIPLIVDNTFGGAGYLFRPADWGANVISHSATKWIGGHGSSIAGVLVDCGNFNWSSGKFPRFTEPSESYHGLKFWDTFGAGAPSGNIAFAVKARVEGLRDWGCTLSPFNSFLLLQGVETLSLRMDRILSNALELAEWLNSHPKVESVNYPGLKNNPNHEAAKKYLKGGFGGVLSFCLKGDRQQTANFVDSLSLITHLVNVGDNKTLISHSASTTHSQLSAAALEAAGLKTNMLRISVGIEHIDDIKTDLEESLKRI
ncbi:MAG: aminotransferase class I/II-fold pyridoxal phosphate-dependent enzyme [Rikenellaceae bacterium]